MKRQGFTLAEVLITLTIIGVIAALSLPALFSNVEKHNWENALKASTNILTNGFAQMMASEGVDRVRDTALWTDCNVTSLVYSKSTDDGKCVTEKMKNYFSITNVADNIPAGMSIFDINNNAQEGAMNQTIRYTLTNNTTININFKPSNSDTPDKTLAECKTLRSEGGTLCGIASDIYVDVNGDKKPNTIGKDVYYFVLGTNGRIYPIGGTDYSLFENGDTTKTWKETCDGKKIDGTSCKNSEAYKLTARVIDDGYKINYIK